MTPLNESQLDLFDGADLTVTQRRLLDRTYKLLATMPVQFAIVEPDGTQRVQGDWELVRRTNRKRRESRYPYGAVRKYLRGFLSDLEFGEVVIIPIGEFEIDAIQGGITSYASHIWGPGSVTTAQTEDKNYVEVMRIE